MHRNGVVGPELGEGRGDSGEEGALRPGRTAGREPGPGTIDRTGSGPGRASGPNKAARGADGGPGGHVSTKERVPAVLCAEDRTEPDSGMNPAEAAEEAPSDPETDAFYKAGRGAGGAGGGHSEPEQEGPKSSKHSSGTGEGGGGVWCACAPQQGGTMEEHQELRVRKRVRACLCLGVCGCSTSAVS